MAVVLDHLLAGRHRGQMRIPLALGHRGLCEQRQVVLVAGTLERLHGPQRGAALEPERIQGIAMGEPLQRLRRQTGAQPEITDRVEALTADTFDLLAPLLRETVDLTETETYRVRGQDVVHHRLMPLMQSTPRSGSIFHRTVPAG